MSIRAKLLVLAGVLLSALVGGGMYMRLEQASEFSLVVMIATGVFATLLTWLTLRSVIIPIERMAMAMTALAGGERDIDLPAVGKDEIGEMAKAVRVFRDNAVEAERLAGAQAETERQRREEEARRVAERSEQEARDAAEAAARQKQAEERADRLRELTGGFDREVTEALGLLSTSSDNMR